VYHDYLTRLQQAITNSKQVERQSLSVILGSHNDKSLQGGQPLNSLIQDINEDPLKADTEFGIILHNSISTRRTQVLRLRCPSAFAHVKDTRGNKLELQISPVLDLKFKTPAAYDVYFVATLDAFAVAKYTAKCISKDPVTQNTATETVQFTTSGQAQFDSVQSRQQSSMGTIANDRYEIAFDSSNGYIKSVHDKFTRLTHEYKQFFMAYQTQRSGSYIFRPNGPPGPVSQIISYVIVNRGPLFEEAIIRGNYYSYSVRVFKHAQLDNRFIELNYDIAPLQGNHELVTRLAVFKPNSAPQQLDGASSSPHLITFDGLQFLKRKVYDRAPLAGHFYPAVAGAMLLVNPQHQQQHQQSIASQLSVLIPHCMAVTAVDNELEFMIHRRLLSDDGRGMSQANNDDAALQFTMLMSYDSHSEFADVWPNLHAKSHILNNPITIYKSEFSDYLTSSFKPVTFDSISNGGASNHGDENNKQVTGQTSTDSNFVQIISMKPRDYASDDIVIRLHNFDHTMHKQVQLSQLFNRKLFQLESVRQKALSLMFDVKMTGDAKLKRTIDIHQQRLSFLRDNVLSYSIVDDVVSSRSDAQNTQEEGVFLSDEAIRLAAAAAARKPLALGSSTSNVADSSLFGSESTIQGDALSIFMPPSSIRTFVVTVRTLDEARAMKENDGVMALGAAGSSSGTATNIVEEPEPEEKPFVPANNNKKPTTIPTQDNEPPAPTPVVKEDTKVEVDHDDREGYTELNDPDEIDKRIIIDYLVREKVNALRPRDLAAMHAASGMHTQFSIGLFITVVGVAALFFYFASKNKKKGANNNSIAMPVAAVSGGFYNTDEYDLSSSKEV